MNPRARPQDDRGPVNPALKIQYAAVIFKKSPEQQAGLDRLLAAQQDPSSPQYHKWLTPEQFAQRFGPSQADLAKVSAWLASQGLTIEDAARGRGWIHFSGTAQQIGDAFHTSIHRYLTGGESRFANAAEPSVPAALAPAVLAIQGLDDFRKKPLLRIREHPSAASINGDHSMVPDDLATIYNISKLYSGGIDGTGQSLAIVGESDIHLSDIQGFRAKYNLPPNDPQIVVYGPDPGFTDAGLESLLDLEWSGAVARSANIIYVNSYSVDAAAEYAIDQDLAPVLSFSFGICEPELSSTSPASMRALAQQAAAEGITWLVASGDAGAASCDTGQPEATNGLAVSFPSSIPEVTSVGGTQFSEGAGNYWNTSDGPNGDSALSYIPEIAWNESPLFNFLVSTGGGASILYPKPLWQTGPGVPADAARDVPDVSLAAAAHDGYTVCFSNTCETVYGTSGSTPSFAGIVALLNQYLVLKGLQFQPGVGNINPALYRLAQSGANIFHDIVSGDNKVACVEGTPGCLDGEAGYASGPGYDPVTGLGSVDAYNLITGWTAPAAATSVMAVAAPSEIALSGSAQVTVTVSTQNSGSPDGTVALLLGSQTLASGALSGSGKSASAALTIYGAQLTLGLNTLEAVYSGSGGFLGSSSPVNVRATVPATNSEVIPAISPSTVYEHEP
ncbi:MAG TPA: protease pro-enzyme activation domain-containing protein, partial [Bryobacteraceae bacterium]|nr:protease pro-enzyme activation domain-containing protein [Bryobacteraceae bacterium]